MCAAERVGGCVSQRLSEGWELEAQVGRACLVGREAGELEGLSAGVDPWGLWTMTELPRPVYTGVGIRVKSVLDDRVTGKEWKLARQRFLR